MENYYSYTVDSDSCGVDCVTKNWAKEIIHVFSLFAIISRMLKEVEKDEATGVIIVLEDPLLLPKTNVPILPL